MAMTNKFSVLSITTLILAAVAESGRNDLGLVTDISGAACPGDMLTYECDIAGPGNTIWNGTAFYCPLKSNEIILRHSQFSTGTSGSCSDRTLIEVQSLGVINNCFSSELNITVTSDLNNKTIRCSHSSSTIVMIGEIRLSVATVPYPSPSNVKLAEARTGELIFRWDESADHPAGLYYIINSTCGSCPNMSSTTMANCSDLIVSTTLTMCTFSVQSVACGTIGSPSLPVVVTLAVPDIPDVAIIPQYSQNNGQLTAIIVRVKQNVTSFSISDSDTIPGSTTSYHILTSSSNSSQPACKEDSCEYTFPPDCSGSSIGIAVAAANRLGVGPSSEPNIIECNNQFVKVEYDPSTTTISCLFENKSDLSQKLCSIRYGLCGKEENFIQKSTTEGSPFTVMLKLSTIATNSKNCYVVMARFSNNTLTVMVKGSFETQSSIDVGVIVGAVIGALIFLGLCLVAVIIIIVIVAYIFYAKSKDVSDPAEEFIMVEVNRDCPVEIKSVQFKETTVQNRCELDDLRPKLGEIIFVDYECHSSEEFIDVMIKDKNGKWLSGTNARDLISQGKKSNTWKKVFLLPKREKISLEKGEIILHQDSDQLKEKQQFRVFDVDKETKLSKFLQQNKFDDDYAKVYYEFKAKMDLFSYREVMEVSNSKLKGASTGNGYIILESSTGRGIHMFYTLKPQAPGENIKPPDIKDGRYFIQSTRQDSERQLKAGLLVLHEEDVHPESHR